MFYLILFDKYNREIETINNSVFRNHLLDLGLKYLSDRVELTEHEKEQFDIKAKYVFEDGNYLKITHKHMQPLPPEFRKR